MINYNLFHNHVVNIWSTVRTKVKDGVVYMDDTPASVLTTIHLDQTIQGRMSFRKELFKVMNGRPILLQFDNEPRPNQFIIDLSGRRNKVNDVMKDCWKWVTERAVYSMLKQAYEHHQACIFSYYENNLLVEVQIMQPQLVCQDVEIGYTPDDYLGEYAEFIVRKVNQCDVIINISSNVTTSLTINLETNMTKQSVAELNKEVLNAVTNEL